jgi:hypothetical protein
MVLESDGTLSAGREAANILARVYEQHPVHTASSTALL